MGGRMKRMVCALLSLAMLAGAGSALAKQDDGSGGSNVTAAFPFREDQPDQGLAELCALYSLLAYNETERTDQGWRVKSGDRSAGLNTLATQLSGDGFDTLASFYYLKQFGERYAGSIGRWKARDPDSEHTSPFILAHRKVYVREPYAWELQSDGGGGSYQDQILVLFRGTTAKEWYGDFDVTGRSYDETIDYHWSFQQSVNCAVEALADYIWHLDYDHKLTTGKISILTTGHSRGGGVANMLAHQLTDLRDGKGGRYKSDKQMKLLQQELKDAGCSVRSVYAYTFAAPNVATVHKIDREGPYDNIFNFCFTDDFVPNLPLEFWQWGKYGRTYWSTAERLKKAIPSFGQTYLQYMGEEPKYNKKYTADIVEEAERLTDIPGDSGVGNYYRHIWKWTLTPWASFHTYMREGVAVAMEQGLLSSGTVNVGANVITFLDNDYSKISRKFLLGMNALGAAHQPISYLAGMETSFWRFYEDGHGNTKSGGDDALSAGWDPALADPAQLAAMEALLARPVSYGEKTVTAAEKLGWDPADPASWTGVTWSGGQLVSLDLRRSGLEGTLSLADFPALEVLDLGCCGLTALDLAGPEGLRTLDVSCNALAALDLSPCPALEELDCSGNALTALDCGGLSRLRDLDCAGNGLETLTLPAEGSLCGLDCAGNRLTSLEGNSLGWWTTYLDCSGNLLDPSEPHLADLYNDINASEDGTAVLLPQDIPEGAVFDGHDLAALTALANQGDNLARLGWDLTDPASWAGITWTRSGDAWYLTGADLRDLGLTGEAAFSGCPCLETLLLDGNGLTGLTAADCPGLQVLWAEGNRLPEAVAEALEGAAALAVLTGGQRTGPETGTLSPEDTAALTALIEALDLSWDPEGLFRNPALVWTRGEDGIWRLTGLDLTWTCPWGDLDLSAFTALETVTVQASQLESVTLPPSVTVVPDRAFAANPVLKQVVFPGRAPAMGYHVFDPCPPDLEVSLTFGTEALPAGETVRLTLASYDGEGRMLSAGAAEGAAGTDLTAVCRAGGAAELRAFFLTRDGMAPLAPPWPDAP